MLQVGWIAMAYVLGSIPFGLFIARMACGIDPRRAGSGNVGATNVARLCGARYGVATLILDIFKGYAMVAVALEFSDSAFFVSLVALASLCGHMFSVFLHGRGGKAVATAVGVFLAISPLATTLSALACIGVIYFYGFVSLGSLTLVCALPLFLLFAGKPAYLPLALLAAALVVVRHKDNIIRLWEGTEKSWKKK
ncbi:MAG: glycerol-3-phosphate 1-O-acyltransferase PlsY [Desulfovibrionaceae bacterium]|nr:glycerol-3-phosphate 1-O-acyltransferase PlsY [Desulfovibrionaceae bacterium]MBF0513479.1 glycerol-3-phosphate 1-O-acyltransferase PlsY [Desulfovibrionaceae bacterium]